MWKSFRLVFIERQSPIVSLYSASKHANFPICFYIHPSLHIKNRKRKKFSWNFCCPLDEWWGNTFQLSFFHISSNECRVLPFFIESRVPLFKWVTSTVQRIFQHPFTPTLPQPVQRNLFISSFVSHFVQLLVVTISGGKCIEMIEGYRAHKNDSPWDIPSVCFAILKFFLCVFIVDTIRDK